MEKLFLAEIIQFDQAEGCYALNAHFAGRFGIGKSRASQIISGLSAKGHVNCTLQRKGKQVISRTITPLGNLKGVCRKPKEGMLEIDGPPLEKREGIKQGIKHTTGFDRFWEAYPRKQKKKRAREIWEKLSPDQELFKEIMSALEKQKQLEDWTKDSGKYIPHPTTWLNNAQWEDEVSAESQLTRDVTEAEAEALLREVVA